MKTAFVLVLIGGLCGAGLLKAQDQAPDRYIVKAGTRIPLVLVNGISTKNAHEGDQVYLQTAFPVAVNNRIVIPEGSYVTGTITQLKRPGRVKGRGEMYLRFDTLMLPNGAQRDFRGMVSGVDGDQDSRTNKEGKIEGDSSKGRDAATIAETTAQGVGTGAVVGAISHSTAKGIGIGGGAGLAAGVATVLLTRGPDIRMPRGSTVEMQLDRELAFSKDDVNFLGSAPAPRIPDPPKDDSSRNSRRGPFSSRY